MPQESELQIDDTTQVTGLKLQCDTCDDRPYLVPGEATSVEATLGDASEYPFTCPTQGCGTRVVLRLHYTLTA